MFWLDDDDDDELVNLTQTGSFGNLNWENPSNGMAHRQVCRGIVLFNNLYGKAQSFVGSLPQACGRELFKEAGWASYREHTNKQRSSVVSASASASRFVSEFLPWLLSCLITTWKFYDEINTFLPNLSLVMVFIISSGNKLRLQFSRKKKTVSRKQSWWGHEGRLTLCW